MLKRGNGNAFCLPFADAKFILQNKKNDNRK
ncbi:hypothetical protein T4B_9986 [Trichinella pseudospiralis]|uniref:Uncharacterized protein n=1 Tax=Trichinella pseudospiralis TaxID=6337 RepID=A0A0V1F2Y3_TRIPS|nr:hypothetical protein T4B_9986 [Trichinella pseudospiralis]